MEDSSSNLFEPSKNVTSGGMILSTHAPRSKLAAGEEEVHVVRPTVRLSHTNDGTIERHVSMVVCRMLSDVSIEPTTMLMLTGPPFDIQ